MLSKKKKNLRVAIMGGTFNPFHLGHKNSLLTVKKEFAIDKFILVPTFQTPLKQRENLKLATHRLKMLKNLFQKTSYVIVDDQEILREEMSYSYKTINNLVKEYKDCEIFLMIGLDQFFLFDQWKYFSRILKKVNLIVTSRPRLQFPKSFLEFPKKTQPLLRRKYKNSILLNDTDKKIFFCPLKDKDISSSSIKKRVQNNQSIKGLVPEAIATYIKKHNMYKSDEDFIQAKKMISFFEKELENKKAFDVQTFDLRKKSIFFSFGIIASCSNTRHTKSLAKHLKKSIRDEFQMEVLNEEGLEESSWIVLDYGEIVIHLFYNYTREIYNLEQIWNH